PVLLGLAALAGCATGRTETPYDPARPRAAAPAGVDPFPYAPGPVAFSNHVIAEEETADYVVRFITIPSSGVNGLPGNALYARYYQRRAGGRKTLGIGLPIWGGPPSPPAIVAADLRRARQGNVMLVLGDHPIIDWDALADAPSAPAFSETMRA